METYQWHPHCLLLLWTRHHRQTFLIYIWNVKNPLGIHRQRTQNEVYVSCLVQLRSKNHYAMPETKVGLSNKSIAFFTVCSIVIQFLFYVSMFSSITHIGFQHNFSYYFQNEIQKLLRPKQKKTKIYLFETHIVTNMLPSKTQLLITSWELKLRRLFELYKS